MDDCTPGLWVRSSRACRELAVPTGHSLAAPGSARAEGWGWGSPCSFWVQFLMGSQVRSQAWIGVLYLVAVGESPGLLGLSVAPDSAQSLGSALVLSGSSPIPLECLGGTELLAGVNLTGRPEVRAFQSHPLAERILLLTHLNGAIWG